MHIRILQDGPLSKGVCLDTPPGQPSRLSPIPSRPQGPVLDYEYIPPEEIGAFIIGIDEYPIRDWRLYKCVTDAVNMRKFLNSIYNIPAENIRTARS